MKRLVLASDNPGKIHEFNKLFAPLGIEVVAQGSLGVTPAEEPFETFLENCLAKARNASRQTGLPAIADDSGICVDALGEPPAFIPPALPVCRKAMPAITSFSSAGFRAKQTARLTMSAF